MISLIGLICIRYTMYMTVEVGHFDLFELHSSREFFLQIRSSVGTMYHSLK